MTVPGRMFSGHVYCTYVFRTTGYNQNTPPNKLRKIAVSRTLFEQSYMKRKPSGGPKMQCPGSRDADIIMETLYIMII
jgi:hypothetical protein